MNKFLSSKASPRIWIQEQAQCRSYLCRNKLSMVQMLPITGLNPMILHSPQ
uniref:Uncharacterized protein n=1 Tax=Rhizophora mucronata TaxID=61149 RepID=A0A2P2QLR4_RHIMU